MTKAKQLILPISYPDSGRWDAPVRKIKIDERTYALRTVSYTHLDVYKRQGQGGSILAGSSVCLTGGLVKGDVYAGGKAGSIQGDTSVTITGTTATLYNGSSWGSISGGGSGGTVDGLSLIHI